MTDHLIVAVVAVISGGFAIPVGFRLDLPAIETYHGAATGALLGTLVFVFIGAGLRDRIVERLNVSDEKPESGREMLGRCGAKGHGVAARHVGMGRLRRSRCGSCRSRSAGSVLASGGVRSATGSSQIRLRCRPRTVLTTVTSVSTGSRQRQLRKA